MDLWKTGDLDFPIVPNSVAKNFVTSMPIQIWGAFQDRIAAEYARTPSQKGVADGIIDILYNKLEDHFDNRTAIENLLNTDLTLDGISDAWRGRLLPLLDDPVPVPCKFQNLRISPHSNQTSNDQR